MKGNMNKELNDLRIDNEGGKYLVGNHYNLKTAKKLYAEEEYDDEVVLKVVPCYIHFGIVWIDGERTTGWNLKWDKPNSMRGYRKATELLFKKDIELIKTINSKYCKDCKLKKNICICNSLNKQRV